MYSRSPYTAELSTCFHLISFSFGSECFGSIQVNKLSVELFLCALYPNINMFISWLFFYRQTRYSWSHIQKLNSLNQVSHRLDLTISLEFVFCVILTVKHCLDPPPPLYSSHTDTWVSVSKVKLKEVWNAKSCGAARSKVLLIFFFFPHLSAPCESSPHTSAGFFSRDTSQRYFHLLIFVVKSYEDLSLWL